jgi:hypothetical protein
VCRHFFSTVFCFQYFHIIIFSSLRSKSLQGLSRARRKCWISSACRMSNACHVKCSFKYPLTTVSYAACLALLSFHHSNGSCKSKALTAVCYISIFYHHWDIFQNFLTGLNCPTLPTLPSFSESEPAQDSILPSLALPCLASSAVSLTLT